MSEPVRLNPHSFFWKLGIPAAWLAAYHCGKDFILSGVPLAYMDEAMQFCEGEDERVYFLMGVDQETRDLASLIDHNRKYNTRRY